MFNIRWSLISGGTALVLAFATSLLLGHTSLVVALARAGIFAVLFAVLGSGIFALINMFIPELLSDSVQESLTDAIFSPGSAGSQVNITLSDDAPNAALPGTDSASLTGDEMGNFDDLVSGSVMRDIDQSHSSSYTENDNKEEFASAFDDIKADDLGDFSMDFGAFVSGGDGMGSADSDMDSFSFFSEPGDSGKSEENSMPERKTSTHKPTDFKGDFNPKEIAAGIRTVLEKDKKG